MKNIFFILNDLSEFDFNPFLKKYLNDVKVTIGTDFPKNPKDYNLIIPWSYKKKINGLDTLKNVIVFHSSDLPEGKGWAPIYNTILKDLEVYTISGILANNKIDDGEIVVKASFKMQDSYIAEYLRSWDCEISILLISKILKKMSAGLVGKRQDGTSSYYKKRAPEDNEININNKFGDIINHLRACENNHPAFFYYKNEKYLITITPESKPDFPKDLEITFYDFS